MSIARETRIGKKGLCIADWIAPIVFVGFFCMYLFFSLHSVNCPDEALYINFAHRFFMGDTPIVDEWGVEQLTGILLLIPFSVYKGVMRTTEGVILFFRILYSVCQALVAIYCYVSLRVYCNRVYKKNVERNIFSAGSLAAIAVFLCFIPLAVPNLSYYAMSLMGLAVMSVTLFCYPPSRLKYYFCGLVFAAVILAEPEAILLHIALIIVLLIIRLFNLVSGKKTASHLFSDKFLLYLNLGGYTLAVIFLIFIQYRAGIKEFAKSVPHVFDGTGYNFTLSDGNIIDLSLFAHAFSLYGSWTMSGLLVLTLLAAILHKYRSRTRVFFCIGLLVFIVLAMVRAWKEEMVYLCTFHGLPLYLSGPAWMLLAEKPDRRMSCAWFVCAMFSVVFSVSSRIAVGWGGVAAGIFSVVLAMQTVIDAVSDMPKMSKKTIPLLVSCTVGLFCLITVTSELQWFYSITNRLFGVETLSCVPPAEVNELDCRISDGPLRGIYTTEQVAKVYDSLLEDAETIRQETQDGQIVYIHNRAPLCYLMLDRDYGAFSTWFRNDEFYRIKMYWNEHPERIPAYVYIPYYSMYSYRPYDNESIEKLQEEMSEVFHFDVTEGKAGRIMRITGQTKDRSV